MKTPAESTNDATYWATDAATNVATSDVTEVEAYWEAFRSTNAASEFGADDATVAALSR